MRKFVLRAALRPNQIEFSHSLAPFLPSPSSGRHVSYPGLSCRSQLDRLNGDPRGGLRARPLLSITDILDTYERRWRVFSDPAKFPKLATRHLANDRFGSCMDGAR